MAASLPPRPPKPGAPPPVPRHKTPRKLSPQDQRELALLDGACARIKRRVPSVPYIVIVPTDEACSYRHYSRQEAQAFTMGGIFARDEERIQYRSFLYRDPAEASLLYLQSGEFDQPRPEPERRKSLAGTTPTAGPNPKKTLSDYNAMKNGVAPKKRSPELPATTPALPPVNPVNDSQDATKRTTPPKPAVTSPRKRPATETLKPEKPEKRRKEVDPQPTRADSPPPAEATASHDGTPHGLPPLLSPVQKPVETRHGLPPLLSPTLPSKVLAALEERELKVLRPDQSPASASSSTKASQPPPATETRLLEAEENLAQANGVPHVSSVPSTKDTAKDAPSEPEDVSNTQLVVKLKYTKRIAKNIASILKLPASRKAQAKTLLEQREKEAAALQLEKAKAAQRLAKERSVTVEPSVPNGVANRIKVKYVAKGSPKVAETAHAGKRPTTTTAQVSDKRQPEKRPGADDDGPAIPSKRPKPDNGNASTPVQQRMSSPPSSPKSRMQKIGDPFATPRKDKNSRGLRSGSVEANGAAVITPTSTKRDAQTTPTPLNARHADVKVTPTSAPAPNVQRLYKKSMQLNALGRTLKREVEQALKEKKPEKPTAVLVLECFITYMAAFAAQDLGRRSTVEQTWKTLLPITLTWEYFTKSIPPLDGLRHYLRLVMNSKVMEHVAFRVEREKAHDSPQATPQSRPADNAAMLAESFRFVTEAAMHSRVNLSYEDIQKHYPKTFAGRETDYTFLGHPDRLSESGPYFLPIGIDTTPLQFVRFALKFLGEYCEKEKIDYTFRLKAELAAQ